MSCIRSCFAAAGACDTAARAPFPCRYGPILDAAERALNAFTAADSARDAADARVHAVSEQARTMEAGAAVSAANASYVEAVGIAGTGEARERAARS